MNFSTEIAGFRALTFERTVGSDPYVASKCVIIKYTNFWIGYGLFFTLSIEQTICQVYAFICLNKIYLFT